LVFVAKQPNSAKDRDECGRMEALSFFMAFLTLAGGELVGTTDEARQRAVTSIGNRVYLKSVWECCAFMAALH
jgi:hypothetical protein